MFILKGITKEGKFAYFSIDDSCDYPYWVDSPDRALQFKSMDALNSDLEGIKKSTKTFSGDYFHTIDNKPFDKIEILEIKYTYIESIELEQQSEEDKINDSIMQKMEKASFSDEELRFLGLKVEKFSNNS